MDRVTGAVRQIVWAWGMNLWRRIGDAVDRGVRAVLAVRVRALAGRALIAVTAALALVSAFLPAMVHVTSDGASTLLRGPLSVHIRAGMGHGRRHAHFERFDSRAVFPVRRGGLLVSFQVKFHKGFEWGCRGKIGGIFVGTGQASGFRQSKRGASHRVMWDSDGGAHAYVYVPKGSVRLQPPELDQRTADGQSVWLEDFAGALRKPDAWHDVRLGVKLNSVRNGVPRNDGKMLLRINGLERVLDGVVWRLFDDVAIESFVINVFHGGPCHATRGSTLEIRRVKATSWHLG